MLQEPPPKRGAVVWRRTRTRTVQGAAAAARRSLTRPSSPRGAARPPHPFPPRGAKPVTTTGGTGCSAQSARIRFSPWRRGLPARSSASRAPASVHPRARGTHEVGSPNPSLDAGSPPRTGRPRPDLGARDGAPFTPADGDGRVESTQRVAWLGSPPRTGNTRRRRRRRPSVHNCERGTHIIRKGPGWLERSPTRTGNTRRFPCPKSGAAGAAATGPKDATGRPGGQSGRPSGGPVAARSAGLSPGGAWELRPKHSCY